MGYNPTMYFPQGYQPLAQPYPAAPQYAPQPAPATRAVEAIPVDSEDQVFTWPVNVGATVLFMAQDDSFVAFKTNSLKGEDAPVFYDKRPPAPPAPVFDPEAYVTKDELDRRLAEISEPRRPKKEEAET